MALNLKVLLEQAEFTKTRGGGYDRTEVDDFLDRAVAMAAKVEAKLTQAIDQGGEGGAPAPTGPSVEEVEAEIERRVAARVATASSGPSEDESAEQVRRTIVLAERTASEAIREAREDAAKLLAEAQERAASLDADSKAHAATLAAEVEATAGSQRAAAAAELEADRTAARARLAEEITSLEKLRDALREDAAVLERHVQEQRTRLHGAVGDLQRLLDDPAGFRAEPAPEPVEVQKPVLSDEPLIQVPDLVGPADASTELPGPEPLPGPAPVVDVSDPAPEPTPLATDPGPPSASGPTAGGSPSGGPEAGGGPSSSARTATRPSPPAPNRSSVVIGEPAPGPAPTSRPTEPGPERLDFAEVDHAEPGVIDLVDVGPPTAPVSAVDLGVQPAPDGDDDAFLAELRKAMADDEPLGPRDEDDSSSPLGPMFEDEDRRGWRFGKRR